MKKTTNFQRWTGGFWLTGLFVVMFSVFAVAPNTASAFTRDINGSVCSFSPEYSGLSATICVGTSEWYHSDNTPGSSCTPPIPGNYGISRLIEGRKDCSGASACTPVWTPSAVASDICTGSSVTQTNQCDSGIRTVVGTKDCDGGGSEVTTRDGRCSLRTPLRCSSGYYSAAPDDTNTHYYWTCGGLGTPRGSSASCEAYKTKDITASAGRGGSISPSGNVGVLATFDQTFTITPDSSGGYAVDDVVVDNVSMGALRSYTFSNVIAPHTISVTFVAGATDGACGAPKSCSAGTYVNAANTASDYRWTCLGTGDPVAGADASCSADKPSPITTFTGTYGGTTAATITLPPGGGSATLDWSTTNATPGTCTGYGAGFAGAGKNTSGSQAVTVNTTGANKFELDCWNTTDNGDWVPAVRKTVTVNVPPPTTVNGVCGSVVETCFSGRYLNSPAALRGSDRWSCLGEGVPRGSDVVCIEGIAGTAFTGTYGTQVNQTTLYLPTGGGDVTLNWSMPRTHDLAFYQNGSSVNWGRINEFGSRIVTVNSPTTFDLKYVNDGERNTRTKSVTISMVDASSSLSAAPSCDISENASACPVSFTWSSNGTTGTVELRNRTTGALYQSGVASDTQSYSITNGENVVELSHGGGVLSAVYPIGKCASGTVWNGGACVLLPPPCPPDPDATCANHAADIANTCNTRDFIMSDGCGGQVRCPGTRVCDYNWKEVAP